MDLFPSFDLKPFPKITRPEIVGAFSVDCNQKFLNGLENLKYLNIPSEINFNLNEGDSNYKEKPDEDSKINHLLKFLTENENIAQSNHFDFLCFRGLLRMIMSTPYEQDVSWIILATRYKGRIFLCSQETDQKRHEKLRRTDRDKMFMRYGFKFENHVLSKHPSEDPPGSKKAVIESEEFCAMFSSTIDGKSILFGAEIDGVISDKAINSIGELKRASLVEVKVKRRETNRRQLQNFYKFKARNYWCQSFLVGIERVFLGLRNDEGIVNEVTSITLKELSDQAKQNNYWFGTVCMNFLNDFLSKVMYDMKDIDDPNIIFKYEWNPGEEKFANCHKIYDQTFCFLSKDFIRFLNNL